MSTTTKSRTRPLRKTDLKRVPEAFLRKVRKEGFAPKKGEFSRMLASRMLKHTAEGQRLSASSDVDSFIRLNRFFTGLHELTVEFLNREMVAVHDVAEIDDLLIPLAAYRLAKLSKSFYQAGLSEFDAGDSRDVWQQRLDECRGDFERLCEFTWN